MRIKWFFIKKYGSKSSAEQLHSHLEKVKKKDVRHLPHCHPITTPTHAMNYRNNR